MPFYEVTILSLLVNLIKRISTHLETVRCKIISLSIYRNLHQQLKTEKRATFSRLIRYIMIIRIRLLGGTQQLYLVIARVVLNVWICGQMSDNLDFASRVRRNGT